MSDDKRDQRERLADPPWTTSNAVKALRGGNPLGSTNKEKSKFIWIFFVYVDLSKGFESRSDVRSPPSGGRTHREAGSGRLVSEVCEANKRDLATVTESLYE
jgi:hypothetical protein